MIRFRRTKVAVAALLIAFSASAVAAEWVPLGESDSGSWDGLAGSVEATTNRAGVKIRAAAGRVFDKKTKSYRFERWYVTVDSCRSGYGKIATTEMNGDFKFETDFVLGGGSIASALADILCYYVKESDQKGI
jgi:opacity protein-like surface antigen